MTEPKFFVPARRFTVAEIASITGAKLLDPSCSETIIERLASANEGGDGALVFVEGKRNAGLMPSVRASAVLCSADIAANAASGVAALVVERPQQAFLKIAGLLFPQALSPGAISGVTGISPHASIHETAELEENVTIEAGAVIGAGAKIGSGTIIGPQAIVGAQCSIGRNCAIGAQSTIQYAMIGDRVILHPGVRIGQDGFGFLPGPHGLVKNPQLGRVIIQNDVEIGANTTVDRGALTDTIVGEGTKVDNLVQIAHNVKIGRFCVIAAHCGISGSVTMGDGVMLGGRVGIADHLTIGNGAQLAAASGVMNDIPAGGRWAGSPAQPIRQAFREIAALRSLAKGDWKGTKGDD